MRRALVLPVLRRARPPRTPPRGLRTPPCRWRGSSHGAVRWPREAWGLTHHSRGGPRRRCRGGWKKLGALAPLVLQTPPLPGFCCDARVLALAPVEPRALRVLDAAALRLVFGEQVGLACPKLLDEVRGILLVCPEALYPLLVARVCTASVD